MLENIFLKNEKAQVFSCEFTIIAALLVLVTKGELTSETVNYDTKIMYQFEPQM